MMTASIQSELLRIETDCDISAVRPKRVIWGVAPTGAPHFGYLPYLLLLNDLMARGADCILLLGNFHAYLDRGKSEWTELDERSLSFRRAFENLGFGVLESKDFYPTPHYIRLLLELSTNFRISDILEAGDSTLACYKTEATAGELIYTVAQIVDVRYLDCDLVLCGQDESDIYRFGLMVLNRVCGHRAKYAYLPMFPGLECPEMHASDPDDNKLLLEDTTDRIRQKLLRHTKVTSGRSAFIEFCLSQFFPFAGLQDYGLEARAALVQGDSKRVADILTAGLGAAVELCRTTAIRRWG